MVDVVVNLELRGDGDDGGLVCRTHRLEADTGKRSDRLESTGAVPFGNGSCRMHSATIGSVISHQKVPELTCVRSPDPPGVRSSGIGWIGADGRRSVHDGRIIEVVGHGAGIRHKRGKPLGDDQAGTGYAILTRYGEGKGRGLFVDYDYTLASGNSKVIPDRLGRALLPGVDARSGVAINIVRSDRSCCRNINLNPSIHPRVIWIDAGSERIVGAGCTK